MIVTLLRHGNTDANNEGWIQGHLDTDLNACGLEQAALAGKRLANTVFEAAFCSDLRRCQQTAQAVLAHHPNTPMQLVKELRERNFGTLAGKSIKELYKSGVNRDMNTYLKEHGGETEAEFEHRVIDGFQQVIVEAEKAGYQDILIVTHGGPLRCLTSWWLQEAGYQSSDGSVIKQTNHGNTAISQIRLQHSSDNQRQGTILLYNSTAHLKDPTSVAPPSV
ncbi:histidine phosphatase superfamily [Radiomyces spectabilis]|uniref:histidine phosphatase superfamily n=1 Tax=Radiomyces spectabilis TaxID=64574 RepID=UPI00221EE2BD|nr:histidine phosphatase superfamily [Radiomyces spectabilis]KAI8373038.1 histidine phosphatase superfamily [Radiomyces spectabilis]